MRKSLYFLGNLVPEPMYVIVKRKKKIFFERDAYVGQ